MAWRARTEGAMSTIRGGPGLPGIADNEDERLATGEAQFPDAQAEENRRHTRDFLVQCQVRQRQLVSGRPRRRIVEPRPSRTLRV